MTPPNPDPPAISPTHLDAIDRAIPAAVLRRSQGEEVAVFNFHFRPDMLPGWTLARAREIDTGRGVRLIQANAAADGANQVARIEIFETAAANDARKLFKETLARFQRDPALIVRTAPQVGEAEASLGQTAFVFLRGNLVITVTAIGAAPMPVQGLAMQVDSAIIEKPAVAGTAIDPDALGLTRTHRPALAGPNQPTIKVFTRRTRGTASTQRFAIARDGKARRIAGAGGGSLPGPG